MSNDTNKKRYYWIKLKSEFMSGKEIDYLMSQQNGAQYVVLYQMLCLACTSSGGELSTQIGEMIIPYDIGKIQRECKYFSEDTIRVAMECYRRLGMIYEHDDGILRINNYDYFIGSETKNAVYQRDHRKKIDNVKLLSNPASNSMSNKILDNRYQIIEKDIREIEDKDILSGKPDVIPQSSSQSSSKKDKYTKERNEIIDYLNLKLGTKYSSKSSLAERHINARLEEGYSIEDFKTVIDKKVKAWRGDPKMRTYLRPQTLFGTKFDEYLNEPEKIETYNEIKNRVEDNTVDDFGNPVDPSGNVTENGVFLYNIHDNEAYSLYCDFKANNRHRDTSASAWEECKKAYYEKGVLACWR